MDNSNKRSKYNRVNCFTQVSECCDSCENNCDNYCLINHKELQNIEDEYCTEWEKKFYSISHKKYNI